jgi:hypothetical protein
MVTVSALWSVDGWEGSSFHTFSLPEDRCVRLLVKKLGIIKYSTVSDSTYIGLSYYR